MRYGASSSFNPLYLYQKLTPISINCNFVFFSMVPDDPEQGFLFMSAVSGIAMPLASPLNAVWVNIL